MRTAFSYPLRSRYSPWMVAGLAYFALCARKKPDRLKQWFPWILAVGWWTWFLFLSVGWTRYAFPALVASHIFVAKFVRDLVGFSELSLSKLRSVIATDDRASVALRVSVVLMFAVFLLVSSSQSMKQIFLEPSQSAQQFAAYLQAHVEKDELVETWEWEVAFLADGVRFHHPPSSLLPILLAHHWFGAPYDPQEYDFQQYSPSYIVVGWFAKTVQNLYPVDFLEKEATLVASIGIYDLYSLNVASEVTR